MSERGAGVKKARAVEDGDGRRVGGSGKSGFSPSSSTKINSNSGSKTETASGSKATSSSKTNSSGGRKNSVSKRTSSRSSCSSSSKISSSGGVWEASGLAGSAAAAAIPDRSKGGSRRPRVGPRLLGKEVLVSDGVTAVLKAVVSAIEDGQARVHYKGRNAKLDEWIDVRSERFLSASEVRGGDDDEVGLVVVMVMVAVRAERLILAVATFCTPFCVCVFTWCIILICS